MTWAGCNFPAELVWEFSCVRACVCVRKRKGQAERRRNLLHYALIWVYVGRVQARIFSLGGPELGLNFVLRYLCRNAPNEFPVCTTAHCFNYDHIKNSVHLHGLVHLRILMAFRIIGACIVIVHPKLDQTPFFLTPPFHCYQKTCSPVKKTQTNRQTIFHPSTV